MSKPITEYTLSELLPHRPPMILLSRVISVSNDFETLIAEVDINENSMFFDEDIDGVPPFVAIEYMAQSLACLSGYNDLERGDKAHMGFVLGSRKLKNNIDKFENGKTYQIVVKQSFFDQALASFDCEICCGDDKDLMSASLNAYRVENMQDILNIMNRN